MRRDKFAVRKVKNVQVLKWSKIIWTSGLV